MREIQLTRGKVMFVDEEDYEWWNQYKWYPVKQTNNRYRAVARINGKLVFAHRFYFGIGKGLSKVEIDHRDRNPLNNTFINLRISNKQRNSLNKDLLKLNKSGYPGVFFEKDRNKWCSEIRIGGKRIRRRFVNKIDAINFYEENLRLYWSKNMAGEC